MHVKRVRLNIFTVILYCVYRLFQNNSCNTITFTDIPFQFILHQQILERIIKAELQFTYFLRAKIFCLFLMFMTDVSFVPLGFPK
jgi:hypothetical protein